MFQCAFQTKVPRRIKDEKRAVGQKGAEDRRNQPGSAGSQGREKVLFLWAEDRRKWLDWHLIEPRSNSSGRENVKVGKKNQRSKLHLGVEGRLTTRSSFLLSKE